MIPNENGVDILYIEGISAAPARIGLHLYFFSRDTRWLFAVFGSSQDKEYKTLEEITRTNHKSKPACDTRCKNRTQATAEGEGNSSHCAIPALKNF